MPHIRPRRNHWEFKLPRKTNGPRKTSVKRTSKDQTLLVGRDALLVLDLLLDILDRVRRLDVEGDRLAGQRLDEDLHASTAEAAAKHQVEGRLLLDVVVGKRAAVLELLA